MSPRPPKPAPTKTYTGHVAEQLRYLRACAGLSVEELRDRLEALGQPVPLSTVYAYERGQMPLPLDLAPAWASALRLLTVAELFPMHKPPRLPRRFTRPPAKI